MEQYKEFLLGGIGNFSEYIVPIKEDTVREEDELHVIEHRAYQKLKDRNEELERKLTMTINMLDEARNGAKQEFFKLESVIDFLKTTLKFFATGKNYEYKEHPDGLDGRGDFPVMQDGLIKAQRAMDEVKGYGITTRHE